MSNFYTEHWDWIYAFGNSFILPNPFLNVFWEGTAYC